MNGLIQILRFISLPLALAAFIVAAQMSGGLEVRKGAHIQLAMK